jgi:beta-lactamase class A
VAHKTGSITRINHDCAIVYLPDGRSYSLTILTRGIDDHDESAALAAELSRIVYDTMMGR